MRPHTSRMRPHWPHYPHMRPHWPHLTQNAVKPHNKDCIGRKKVPKWRLRLSSRIDRLLEQCGHGLIYDGAGISSDLFLGRCTADSHIFAEPSLLQVSRVESI